jgi:uncharacterized integral membrane protein
MRLFYLIVLLIILAAVIIFVWQNDESVTLRFFEWKITLRMALWIAASYVLGMVSGWSVFGFLRRSIRRVTEHRKVEGGG